MQEINYLELEQEISRLTTAIMTRNSLITKSLILDLRDQFSLRDIAGIVLVSLERLVWFDAVAFCWAVDNMVPSDIVEEIRTIISMTVCRRLIDRGFLPGQDFSVDSQGGLLLNDRARAVMFG